MLSEPDYYLHDQIVCCTCCGVYLPRADAEFSGIGTDVYTGGLEDQYMCQRCFHQECDCNEED